MKPNQPTPRSRIKAASAVIGGSAIIVMGALATSVVSGPGGTIVSDPGTFTSPAVPEMTTGDTAVVTTTELTRAPEVASPPVTAEPPEAP
ncbi:hypothetical protein OG976_06385 [Mycobacterium sp. NBC_00419]|uniref:hypothetical protein n=1 Tax=Mycobacterium sp. NBC_00419 TaxID=2975989 RepID=UPI002E1CAD09